MGGHLSIRFTLTWMKNVIRSWIGTSLHSVNHLKQTGAIVWWVENEFLKIIVAAIIIIFFFCYSKVNQPALYVGYLYV